MIMTDAREGAPLQWFDCTVCGGDGTVPRRVMVYEHGCGFPHDDTVEEVCEACLGNGGRVDEAGLVAEYLQQRDCEVCGGDCSAANPPVTFCPKEEDRRAVALIKAATAKATGGSQ